MKPRAEKDKKYEERHREERKAKSLVWGTSVPRKEAVKKLSGTRSIPLYPVKSQTPTLRRSTLQKD